MGDLVQVYQTRGNDYYELWLCERCAAVLGVESTGEEAASAEELLSGLVSADALSCPGCGTSFQTVEKRGTVGCAECYRAFAGRIRAFLQELEIPLAHTGRFPERLASYKRLLMDREAYRDELKRAVEAEEYERAAQLRDELDQLDGVDGEKR